MATSREGARRIARIGVMAWKPAGLLRDDLRPEAALVDAQRAEQRARGEPMLVCPLEVSAPAVERAEPEAGVRGERPHLELARERQGATIRVLGLRHGLAPRGDGRHEP